MTVDAHNAYDALLHTYKQRAMQALENTESHWKSEVEDEAQDGSRSTYNDIDTEAIVEVVLGCMASDLKREELASGTGSKLLAHRYVLTTRWFRHKPRGDEDSYT